MRWFATTALAALAAAGLATAADARRVTVDNKYPFFIGGCALDEDLRTDTLCTPIGLGFNIRVTRFKDDEFGDIFDYYDSLVLFDDGLISLYPRGCIGFCDAPNFFPGFPDDIKATDWPVVVAEFERQDFQPLGQFVRKGNSGEGFFEVVWFRALVTWTCTEYDEFDPERCIDGFFTTFEQAPHVRLLIESLPEDSTRFTLRWTEGARNFGYALGTDVRALGGNRERSFQFFLGGVVPEPASWAMMIAGFGLVGVTARRRRRLPAV